MLVLEIIDDDEVDLDESAESDRASAAAYADGRGVEMDLTQEAEASPEPAMSDDELCALIDHMSANALGGGDEFSDSRRKALAFYYGEAKDELAPPEVEGRSGVVSRDLMDTVEWIMPSLMRIFAGTDSVVEFQASRTGEETGAEQATMYCGYVLFKQNPGFTIIHDTIKTALIQRLSFVKVWTETETVQARESYGGLSDAEFQMLQLDQSVEVADVQSAPGPDGLMLHDVEVVRVTEKPKHCVSGVPPEEVRVDASARGCESMRYAEHVRDVTLSDLRAMGFAQDLLETLSSSTEADQWGEREERDAIGDIDAGDRYASIDESQREVTLQECYLQVDYDGDGIAEWRRVQKVGTTLLTNEPCEDHAFATCSAILMPYRLAGPSFYDLLRDLMRIRTAIQRQMLDNMYLVNNARTEVVEGQVNLDDLLNPRPGGLVRVNSPGQMREIATTPMIDASLAAVRYFDSVRQMRTGVVEFNSAVNPEDAGDKSGVAVDLLQSAARERIELIARVIGETFMTRMYKLILREALQHQDGPLQVNVTGSPLEMNPREWSQQYQVSVSVGLGSQSRGAQAAQLERLMMVQKELMPLGLARPEHIARAAKRYVEALGHKDSAQYIVDANAEQVGPPQQPEDPAVLLAQVEREKIQSNERIEMQKAQLKAQENQLKAAELQMQAQQVGVELQIDMGRFQLEVLRAGQPQMQQVAQ